MDNNNTVHVDNFLFDERTVDDLCDQGVIARNYCSDCGSKNVVPLSTATARLGLLCYPSLTTSAVLIVFRFHFALTFA